VRNKNKELSKHSLFEVRIVNDKYFQFLGIESVCQYYTSTSNENMSLIDASNIDAFKRNEIISVYLNPNEHAKQIAEVEDSI